MVPEQFAMIKNLILDYNGVINDDFEYGYNAAMKVFDKFKLPRIPLEQAREEFEVPVENFYTKYLGEIPFETFRKEYFLEYTDEDNPKLFPDVKETLDELVKRGVNLVILSSHKVEKIYKELDEYKIDREIFDEIIGGAENKLLVIDALMQKHNFENTQTAYVGDTIHDIEVAKQAKVLSIASTYGYQSKSKLAVAHPDHYIAHFNELLTILI